MIKRILFAFLLLGVSLPAFATDHAVPVPSTDGDWSVRKGLRFGYNYANKADHSDRIASPHMFAMGFELQETMSGGSWLDLLFIQNVTISGLEQSVIIPTANALVGFEINNVLQLGVGANLAIYDPAGKDHFVHLVTAIGWTQEAGVFSVPIHLVYIPDVDDYWRCAVTTGVNW